jgi:hypothetical protein
VPVVGNFRLPSTTPLSAIGFDALEVLLPGTRRTEALDQAFVTGL